MAVDSAALIKVLNRTCLNALQSAAGLCLSRTNPSVEIEHWLVKLVEQSDSDLNKIFRNFEINPSKRARKTRPILPDDSRRGGCSRGCSGVRRSRRCTGHYRRRCRFAPFDGCRLYAARAEQSYCPDQEKNSHHCAISRKLTANER